MAGLDPNYIVAINLGEVFVDMETGLPLSGGKLYFYKDEARSVPKTVYELTGSPPNYLYEALPNPIILSAVGTIVNANGDNVPIYYYPYDSEGNVENYYVVVFSEDDVEQFVRQAWPNVTETTTPGGDGSAATVQNQLSNSQFVDVTFPTDTGLEISWTGALSETTYTIAPDWDLVIEASGTGSVTINRTALTGSLNVTTNPPFELDIVASSVNITTLKLVQRLSNNPDIWAEQYVAGTMLVQSLDGTSRTFSMIYAPSVAVSETTIVEGASGASDYTELKGSVQLPQGTNSHDGDDGYVDIEIILPLAGHYTLTSIQLTNGDAEPTIDNIEYQQDPANRQKDFSFHHYRPQIIQLAVPSVLEGWDFRVNPSQWGASQSMGAVASQYLWDQTIGFQSVNSAISAARGANEELEITVGTTCQFALIQYLEGAQLQQLLQSNFSTLITALTDIAGGVTGTVSFWVTTDASLPDVATGANLSLVASLNADGKPATFNGNWTEVARSTGWDAKFTIPEQSEYAQIPLEGWNASTLANAATYTFGAIVIGFSETDAGAVNFQSISVTPTLIASPFAPLSYQLTLNQLQRYWEQSYAPGTAPGTATSLLSRRINQGLNPTTSGSSLRDVHSQSFQIVWNAEKRTAPSVSIYNPITGASGSVHIFIVSKVNNNSPSSTNSTYSSFWFGSLSENSTGAYFSSAHGGTILSYESPGSESSINFEAILMLHLTADARLGIV